MARTKPPFLLLQRFPSFFPHNSQASPLSLLFYIIAVTGNRELVAEQISPMHLLLCGSLSMYAFCQGLLDSVYKCLATDFFQPVFNGLCRELGPVVAAHVFRNAPHQGHSFQCFDNLVRAD